VQIVAIGRNYVDHAKELGNAIPKGKWTTSNTPGLVLTLVEPFFFLKPTSSYISPGEGPVELPKGTIVHHEGGSGRL
jgi:acylpyruvate hydrolase